MSVTYKSTQKPVDGKISPQALIVYNAISAVSEEITLKQWSELCVEHNLQTRQEPLRIVMWYRGFLLEQGYVERFEVKKEKVEKTKIAA